MQGEHLVIGFPRHEIRQGREQLRADHAGKGAADEIKQEATNEVLQANDLVVNTETEITQPALGLEGGLGFWTCRGRGQGQGHDWSGTGLAEETLTGMGAGLFLVTQAE